MSIALQKEKLDMSTARMLIDETAKKFPKHNPENKYLGKNARIVNDKHFETGIVKILDGKGNELSFTKFLQYKRLKKHEDDEENQTPVIVESDFAEEILQKMQKKGDESKYPNCRFLFPTSNREVF